jgi:hypothetical protein
MKDSAHKINLYMQGWNDCKTEYEEKIEAARNLFDSITCLCVEGVEVCKRDAIIMKISQEALKGLQIAEGW